MSVELTPEAANLLCTVIWCIGAVFIFFGLFALLTLAIAIRDSVRYLKTLKKEDKWMHRLTIIWICFLYIGVGSFIAAYGSAIYVMVK